MDDVLIASKLNVEINMLKLKICKEFETTKHRSYEENIGHGE